MAFLDKTGLTDLWNRILVKLGSKVDKIPGKQLSTNDYTNEDKAKLNRIEGLPEADEEHNGAFLRVKDGAWTISVLPNAEEVGF